MRLSRPRRGVVVVRARREAPGPAKVVPLPLLPDRYQWRGSLRINSARRSATTVQTNGLQTLAPDSAGRLDLTERAIDWPRIRLRRARRSARASDRDAGASPGRRSGPRGNLDHDWHSSGSHRQRLASQ